MADAKVIFWEDQEITLPAEFVTWLEAFNPDQLELGYTGWTWGLLQAWEAGRDLERSKT